MGARGADDFFGVVVGSRGREVDVVIGGLVVAADPAGSAAAFLFSMRHVIRDQPQGMQRDAAAWTIIIGCLLSR